jgi:uncharacterized protein (DUF2236 family)
MTSDRTSSLGPGAVSWRLHREVALLAGWGRAILLQLAHPLVAQGVAQHSAFLREPHGHVRRLRRTLGSMLALTFGSDEEACRAAARINAIHDRVHGRIEARHGAHPAGTSYSAHDPELLAWVHGTLLDSFLVTFQLFVADLTQEERDRYCAESSRIERLLGIPADRLPRSHEALQRYLASMLASDEISVTDTARAIAHAVVYPSVAWPARPLTALSRLLTVGLLPPAIRDAYHLGWSPRRERAFRLIAATSRRSLPLVPAPLRHWPAARRAAIRVKAANADHCAPGDSEGPRR